MRREISKGIPILTIEIISKMNNPLLTLKQIADELNLIDIANIILEDSRFSVWSGSSKPYQHHYGFGGLAQHTCEVVNLCIQNNNFFEKLNKSVSVKPLFLAALFHDVGKMWDYTPTNKELTEWTGNSHKRNIHHISRSAIEWSKAFDKYPVEDFHDEVLHAILAHHQMREWGSPVSPNSRLAWLLHLCDGISARIDDVEKWDRTK